MDSGSSGKFNFYTEGTCVPGVFISIGTYVVYPRQLIEISGFVGWGDYDGEFQILVDNTIVGGGRSSPSDRTASINYLGSTILADSNSVLDVKVKHFAPSNRIFKCNILGLKTNL